MKLINLKKGLYVNPDYIKTIYKKKDSDFWVVEIASDEEDEMIIAPDDAARIITKLQADK